VTSRHPPSILGGVVTVSQADHRDSGAWHAADDLAQHIYRVTWKFVQSDPGLAQRMRGAAISIAAQIAEACRWNAGGRWRRALQNASAAAGELNYYLHFARRAGLLGENDLRRMAALGHDVEQQLESLLSSSRSSGTPDPHE